MAEPDTATLAVASLPSSDDLERATSFAREPFLLEGEDAAVSLAPGAARRVALDWALKELAEGATAPSSKWRRRWSLLLGLDRLLSQDEPTLVDGTVLSAHQVDALSGTLTALLAEAQRSANGAAADEPLMLASAAIPGEEDLPEELRGLRVQRRQRRRRAGQIALRPGEVEVVLGGGAAIAAAGLHQPHDEQDGQREPGENDRETSHVVIRWQIV